MQHRVGAAGVYDRPPAAAAPLQVSFERRGDETRLAETAVYSRANDILFPQQFDKIVKPAKIASARAADEEFHARSYLDQLFRQHKKRGRTDPARHQQRLAPARRFDVVAVSQRAEKIHPVSRPQIGQRLRAAPQNLINEIDAGRGAHGHAPIIGHRSANQRLINSVRLDHRELARQYRNILVEAQSQIAVPAPGADVGPAVGLGKGQIVAFNSRYSVDHCGECAVKIAESASGIREVSLSLAERNRAWQRRLQFSLLRVSLSLLTLIAVSAIAIDGNFQNRDSRNRGFSRMRRVSADYPWTIRGARANPRLRINEGQ